MTSRDIRRQFLDFFASKGHKIIPSAPIVAKSDPTLLFINSGMAPLKDFFLGNQTPPSPRVADTQKCLRVSGKHNDLEDVGFDGYHHTMFEMLGNWSFGDYFKKDAIAWSWELLTEVYKIPKDRLYVSVFRGDDKENLPFDQEAHDEWLRFVPEDRILAFGKKENFWEMGEQGPCGPCSEIHVDMRSDEARAITDGKTLVNADDPNVIEIWNNVFMQFNRRADGSLDELPAKSVDTGMGFERLCRAVQGGDSNYDTDLWKPLIGFLENFSGIPYTGTYPGLHADWTKTDVAMRVVADHLRAVCFTIADGELPSSTGAGYVIRRILRRAVRYYYSFLNLREPVMYRMAPILAEEFADVFPELKAQVDFVVKVVLEEEKSFLRTLESGLKRIDALEVANNSVSGEQAFELYDTFGFPFDLTNLIAREKGWSVDEAGFEKALAEQKTRSRKDAAKEVGDWIVVRDEANVQFIGYDQLELRDAYATKYRTVMLKGKPQIQLVLNRTPFYPEGGGQVGDTGFMDFSGERVQVLDTKKENDLIIHIVDKLPARLEDTSVHCTVDARKRQLTENNHSATHLMHAALRQVLGTHVQQKGSSLDDQALRFDFAHFQKMTDAEIAEIERIVNEKIRENIALEEARNLPIEEARASGAMMLFGEKYGETVRMITFDPAYSRELCGGCHVKQTGQIGLFKIVGESAVAAGVRRIEAITAVGAEKYFMKLTQEMNGLKILLKTQNPVKSIEQQLETKRVLEKNLEQLYLQIAEKHYEELVPGFETLGEVNYLCQKIKLNDANVIKTLTNRLEATLGNTVILFAVDSTDKIQLTIRISENLSRERGFHAGKIMKKICEDILNGSGGGNPTYAQGSGNANNNWLEVVDRDLRILIDGYTVVDKPNKKFEVVKKIITTPLMKEIMLKYAKNPYKEHHNSPSWNFYTGKPGDYQRKTILKQGRLDLDKPYRGLEYDFELLPIQLVDMYCYFYMLMHYASSLAMYQHFTKEISKLISSNNALLLLDYGCGPFTAGASFLDYYYREGFNQKSPKPSILYVGFDYSEAAIKKAEEVANDELFSEFVDNLHFTIDQEQIFEIMTFKKINKHTKTTIVINLCYVMASDWFNDDDNLNKFVGFVNDINEQSQGNAIYLWYQNPDSNYLHKNWEQLKIQLKNNFSTYQAGVIYFNFSDVVGSWNPKYNNNQNLPVYVEWLWNKIV